MTSVVRRLQLEDAESFHALRLRGLKDDPGAFASSYEEECLRTHVDVERILAPSDERAVFGAYVDGVLVGIVGIRRETQAKLRHKAHLWGVYVSPEQRGKGVSRALLSASFAFARTMPQLRQLNLTVNAQNAVALALYRRLGFIEFGREQDSLMVDGQFNDEVHMARGMN